MGAGAQNVDLTRVQDVLELAQDAGALSAPGFWINEHQQGDRGRGCRNLERHRRLFVLVVHAAEITLKFPVTQTVKVIKMSAVLVRIFTSYK